MTHRTLDRVLVRSRVGDPSKGLLVAGGLAIPCALGRGGVARRKREGDGATPAATLRPVALMARRDRLHPPATGLPASAILPTQGWCDDPRHPLYNRKVRLPFRASHETMWREDGLYDLVVELDWNRGPAVKGRGSAIFMHVARPGFAPTEGCIALAPAALRRLLPMLTPRTRFVVR
ncbi:L,D-transpeptidase family protein [Alsobacter sp. SYSU M60028]|uniref:L,D-transpeptidase family protein n=1 Tax=Alsobacter ponti TaxID=2962936 RepID=A0ABT1LDB8_9HYPH|nr:L,D-transpeptidase family protein [Alsobacter ponti]